MGFWGKAFEVGMKAVENLNEQAIKKQQEFQRSMDHASTRSDQQLIQDIKDDSFFGPSHMDKLAAKKTLMERHPERFKKK